MRGLFFFCWMVSGWWQLKYFFYVHPRSLGGEMIQFDYFFWKWVGSTTNQVCFFAIRKRHSLCIWNYMKGLLNSDYICQRTVWFRCAHLFKWSNVLFFWGGWGSWLRWKTSCGLFVWGGRRHMENVMETTIAFFYYTFGPPKPQLKKSRFRRPFVNIWGPITRGNLPWEPPLLYIYIYHLQTTPEKNPLPKQPTNLKILKHRQELEQLAQVSLSRGVRWDQMYRVGIWRNFTPLKTNISPEKWWLESMYFLLK